MYQDKERNWKNDSKVVVISNPLTVNVEKHSSCSEKRVVAAGRLAYQKHFDALIDAWNIVHKKHQDWQLDIWGDGTEKDALQNQINQYGLQDTIQLKGYAQNVIEKMSDYSIFALSSRFEGFGLVILEAMANGVPVVSFACPCGPKDIITDGKDGILVPHENTALLAQGIINLIENEAKRIEMGQNAIIKAGIEHKSIARHCLKYPTALSSFRTIRIIHSTSIIIPTAGINISANTGFAMADNKSTTARQI